MKEYFFEKVNPSHPDKIADRIAGAMVDLAYKNQEQPKVAVEVLIGHGECNIIVESSYEYIEDEVNNIVKRIAGDNIKLNLKQVPQDIHLADNQKELRCGDNGIFKGMPVSYIERELTDKAAEIYKKFPTDGKYLINEKDNIMTICQSNAKDSDIRDLFDIYYMLVINPLGYWTGGINVDSGATNRKLGSDLGRAVTGGGLHGKDLSKADVSVNIYCHLLAQKLNKEVQAICNIGNKYVKFIYKKGFFDKVLYIYYADIVKEAGDYIKQIGGFEALAEWGLVR